MKQSVQVTILGQSYLVRSEAGAEQVKKVAAYADQRLEEIRRAGKTTDSQGVAVLALLNVTGELLELREKGADSGPCEARLQALVERLDKAL